jgi:hypothetical protein
MRVVIGIVLIAVTGCVFTLITAVIFLTQHLFASLVLASLLAAAVAATERRRRRARRAQSRSGYPTSVAGPQLPPTSRWAAREMSSAAPRPRRLPPGARGCLP